MRLFVGIPLAAKVIGELSATCGRLRSGGDGLLAAIRQSNGNALAH